MPYNAGDIGISESVCPNANPQTCCEVMVEHTSELVPPAIIYEMFPICVKRCMRARVEKVCPEKVIIYGMIHKKIIYKTINQCGKIIDSVKYDHAKFHCFIDREDANEGDKFKLVGTEILCVVYEKPEDIISCFNDSFFDVACKFVEKDIVKVCVRKDT